MPDDSRQTLERTQIGDNGNAGFPNGKDGVPGGDTDIAGAEQVHAPADTVAVRCGDDRFSAFFDGVETFLDPKDFLLHPCARIGAGPLQGRPHLQEIKTRGETLALRLDDDDPDIRVGVE